MTSKHANARMARKQARLARLPRFLQGMLADRQSARAYLAAAPFARIIYEVGIELTPGCGVTQHDAMVAIVRDMAGEVSLSDGEFEYCMRVLTPPECREREQ